MGHTDGEGQGGVLEAYPCSTHPDTTLEGLHRLVLSPPASPRGDAAEPEASQASAATTVEDDEKPDLQPPLSSGKSRRASTRPLIRAFNAAKYKTCLCSRWLKSSPARCEFGERCWFAHGEDDLATVDSPRVPERWLIDEMVEESRQREGALAKVQYERPSKTPTYGPDSRSEQAYQRAALSDEHPHFAVDIADSLSLLPTRAATDLRPRRELPLPCEGKRISRASERASCCSSLASTPMSKRASDPSRDGGDPSHLSAAHAPRASRHRRCGSGSSTGSTFNSELTGSGGGRRFGRARDSARTIEGEVEHRELNLQAAAFLPVRSFCAPVSTHLGLVPSALQAPHFGGSHMPPMGMALSPLAQGMPGYVGVCSPQTSMMGAACFVPTPHGMVQCTDVGGQQMMSLGSGTPSAPQAMCPAIMVQGGGPCMHGTNGVGAVVAPGAVAPPNASPMGYEYVASHNGTMTASMHEHMHHVAGPQTGAHVHHIGVAQSGSGYTTFVSHFGPLHLWG